MSRERAIASVTSARGVPHETVRVARAPYRFCPLGAHVDHQDGIVTGFALDRALHLAWTPSTDAGVELRSLDTEGVVRFGLGRVPPRAAGDWGDYARGAARVLLRGEGPFRGIHGVVAGEMRPGGVSSSAALGVACLLALEEANDLEVSAEENVELDRRIENEYLGLRNGILDPSMILHGRAGRLLELDCRTRARTLHPLPPGVEEPIWLAAFSGLERALVSTGFNERVHECRRAAAALLCAADLPIPATPVLRDVPPDALERYTDLLDPVEARRARHFAGEMRRVAEGRAAWRAGDLDRFGTLLTASCRSSVENYECGSPELVTLSELLAETPGVLGARFAGAGFRGYCVALVRPPDVDSVVERVGRRYLERHPEHAGSFHVHACRSADGAA